jgi:hypothetical protein
MERDPDAPKGGYSAQSYIETLCKVSCLTIAVRSFSCRITLAYTQSVWCGEFNAKHGITTLDWTPYLNHIEHM